MIEGIGEAAVQQTTRADHNQDVTAQDFATQKTFKQAGERKVEGTEAQTESGSDPFENAETTKYAIEDKTLVIEKYSKNGQLVLRLPPVHTDKA